MKFKRIKLIMLDPGHGGKDPGAVYNNTREKEINLQISNNLYDMLDLTYPFFPYRTRGNDIFVDLEHRIRLANDIPVDFFISIHCNASTSKKPHGIQVYYYRDDIVEIAADFLNKLLMAYPLKTKWNGCKKASYYVLKHANIPALLLELGFITNDYDRVWVTNYMIQCRITDAITEALVNWNVKKMMEGKENVL